MSKIKNISKKLKRNIKRKINEEFLKIKNAFSLVEIAISLLVISIILAALTPTVSKRLSATSSLKNRISTNCNSIYTDGFCAMCYITPKKCVVCTKNCASNQFKNVDNCVCEECSIKYSKNCSRCNSKACLQCEQGYYLDSQNNCTKCPKGYKCYQSGGESIKVPCEKGAVAANEGMSECIKCNQSTSSQQGSVATTTGMSACVLCTNGSYASRKGQDINCESCPRGHYCPQGKLIPCPVGSAQGSTGQTACINCLQSTSNQQGSVATTTGLSACVLCGNGQYAKNSAQTTSCESCPQGRYCPNGKLLPCPQGTAQPNRGQTSCISCVKSTSTATGSVATQTGQANCTTCGNGYYASVNAQKTACQKCPASFYCSNGRIQSCAVGSVSSTGAGSCSSCGSGKTSVSNACQSCNARCSECYGDVNKCTSCKQGYYLQGNNCQSCPSRAFCAGGTAQPKYCSSYHAKCSTCNTSTCTACDKGYEVDAKTKGCKVSFDCAAAGGKVCGNMCLKNVNVNTFGCQDLFAHTAKKTAEACQALGSGWRHVSNDESCIAARNCGIQAPIHGNCYDNNNGFSFTQVCYSWFQTGGNPAFWCSSPNGEIWSNEKCMYSWRLVRAYSSFPQGCVHAIE